MQPLPLPIATYVQAVNAHDIPAVLHCFAPEAHVHDEGQDYYGRAEIGAWLTRTQQATPFTQEVTHVEPGFTETVVTLLVTGDFPGSPLHLYAHFQLDAALIHDLRIQG